MDLGSSPLGAPRASNQILLVGLAKLEPVLPWQQSAYRCYSNVNFGFAPLAKLEPWSDMYISNSTRTWGQVRWEPREHQTKYCLRAWPNLSPGLVCAVATAGPRLKLQALLTMAQGYCRMNIERRKYDWKSHNARTNKTIKKNSRCNRRDIATS